MGKVFRVCKKCNIKKRIKDDFKNEKSEICDKCLNEEKRRKMKRTLRQRKEDVTKTKNFRGFYLYRFLDEDDNILYIGKTTNFIKRMATHFGKEDYHNVLLMKEEATIDRFENEERYTYLVQHHGHLPLECYESVRNIEKIEVDNQYEMDISEIHLINKYRPEYNIEYKYNNVKKLFDIKEPRWLRTVNLKNIHTHYIITNNSTKLYDLIKDEDILTDLVSRNLEKSEEELIKLCEEYNE